MAQSLSEGHAAIPSCPLPTAASVSEIPVPPVRAESPAPATAAASSTTTPARAEAPDSTAAAAAPLLTQLLAPASLRDELLRVKEQLDPWRERTAQAKRWEKRLARIRIETRVRSEAGVEVLRRSGTSPGSDEADAGAGGHSECGEAGGMPAADARLRALEREREDLQGRLESFRAELGARRQELVRLATRATELTKQLREVTRGPGRAEGAVGR